MTGKYFSPSEKHLEGKSWPECDCMTCASDADDEYFLEEADDQDFDYEDAWMLSNK